MIRLRPHHLLCIRGWRGQGYDAAFSANFDRIIAELKAGAQVELVDGADDVCAFCPKKELNECSSANLSGAAGIDERLIGRVNLITGRIYASESLFDSVKKVTPADLESICRGCSWLPGGWCQTSALGAKRLIPPY